MRWPSKPPSISVLMPVYNCGTFLDAAIQSIRCQTFDDFELVIVNDGSTDASLAIIQQHAAEDSRIVVLDRPNGGIVDALNAGLEVCAGEFIARMDGDDVADPSRFAKQIAYLHRNPSVGAVGSGAQIIDENGDIRGTIDPSTDPTDIHARIIAGSYAILHPTMMIRRVLLTAVGGYDPTFDYAEDLDLLIRLSAQTKLANLPEHLLLYRKRRASMSDVGVSEYPEWDFQALQRARDRKQPIPAVILAQSAERVSWTALDRGEWSTAWHWARIAIRSAPLSLAGWRAMGRVMRRRRQR